MCKSGDIVAVKIKREVSLDSKKKLKERVELVVALYCIVSERNSDVM